MNKVHDISIVCSSIGGGGAEKVAVNFANELSKYAKVNLIYFSSKHCEYEISNGVNVFFLDSRSIFGKIISIRKLFKKILPSTVLSFADIPNIVCWIATYGQKNSIKHFTSVRNDVAARKKYLPFSLKLRILDFLNKRAVIGSTAAIVPSNGCGRSLARYYSIPESKISTIYNPILEHNKVLLSGKKIDSDSLRLLAVGRIAAQKNYSLMLNAIKRASLLQPNKKYVLDIYGDGPLKNSVLNEIRRLDLEDQVRLKGHVADPAEVYPRYDIFLHASNFEGLGNVLIEALSHNMAVVSTNYDSGGSEILDDGRFGYLSPVNDVARFAENICLCLENKKIDYVSDLEQHLKKFTIKNSSKKLREVLFDRDQGSLMD